MNDTQTTENADLKAELEKLLAEIKSEREAFAEQVSKPLAAVRTDIESLNVDVDTAFDDIAGIIDDYNKETEAAVLEIQQAAEALDKAVSGT